jgi:hypothetical protein
MPDFAIFAYLTAEAKSTQRYREYHRLQGLFIESQQNTYACIYFYMKVSLSQIIIQLCFSRSQTFSQRAIAYKFCSQ